MSKANMIFTSNSMVLHNRFGPQFKPRLSTEKSRDLPLNQSSYSESISAPYFLIVFKRVTSMFPSKLAV